MEDFNQHCPLVQFTCELLGKTDLNRAIYQLQHHSGFNMNMIFYLLWLAKSCFGRLTKRQLKALEGHILVWHQRVVAELKYTYALVANHPDPIAVQIKQALQTEIMRAHHIEQRLLFDSNIKTQSLRRTAHQQLADACASLVSYCELKNDFLIPEDKAAFVLLFTFVFNEIERADIEKQVSLLADQFRVVSGQLTQQALWD
ncbi:MAG: DUF2390 domain-containing protein [Coxiellaceae bacterium]|nr:DUF2390 domain-containing protein [Coxiellaceae bacterium]